MITETSLGHTLRAMRTEQDVSVRELHERTGVHTETIYALERGKQPTTVKMVLTLSNGLEVDVVELVGRAERHLDGD